MFPSPSSFIPGVCVRGAVTASEVGSVEVPFDFVEAVWRHLVHPHRDTKGTTFEAFFRMVTELVIVWCSLALNLLFLRFLHFHPWFLPKPAEGVMWRGRKSAGDTREANKPLSQYLSLDASF